MSEEKKKQVIALGQLGWTLRRIQKETGIRRETAAGYLKAAGLGVRPPGGWGRQPPAKPANEVATGFGADSNAPPPATTPPACTSHSSCEPYREWIKVEISKGCNATGIYQDMVDSHGFTGKYPSVKRFVRLLCGFSPANTASSSWRATPKPAALGRS